MTGPIKNSFGPLHLEVAHASASGLFSSLGREGVGPLGVTGVALPDLSAECGHS